MNTPSVAAAVSPPAVEAARPVLSLALLGNPNCGKTALFNLLTGSRQAGRRSPTIPG